MENGESVAEGAARELLEESCLNINWWNFLDKAQISANKNADFGFLRCQI